MRSLFFLLILRLATVKGDARLRRENYELHAIVERGDFSPPKEDGAVTAIIEQRADAGAVASDVCGFLGGQISASHV
jgi:hypothetical protein